MTPAALPSPRVTAFFDPQSSTFAYVVQDPLSTACALIDCVLNFDYASGQVSYHSAQQMIDFVQQQGLQVLYLIETHVHADHLSAAPYIQSILGGQIGISEHINSVQEQFGRLFNEGTDFARDGSQFDLLFTDGQSYHIGALACRVMHTPGHTPACTTHVIGDAAFVGDTLFMPDSGTARADFPGGDAHALYRSIQTILALPDATRLFVCHDYCPSGRDCACQTTVQEQRQHNIHVHSGISEQAFVAMRQQRDLSLGMPKLIFPSLQTNMRAGHFPPPQSNETVYLKVPISGLK